MTSLKEIAINLAKGGMKVFPLIPLSKIPAINNGAKGATSDVKQVEEWWSDNSNYNIGLCTTDFFVLDIDQHDKSNGFRSLEMLENTFEPLPATFTVKTANEGRHYYFMKPKNITVKQKIGLLEGVDVKAHENNYIVAPHSMVKRDDGSIGVYEPLNKSDVLQAPKWLITYITKGDKPQYRPSQGHTNRYRSNTTSLLETLVSGLETGKRNDTLTRITGQLLSYAVDVKSAYQLVQFMNGNSSDPLDDKELNRTFESIVRKEFSA